ncbi:MAG: MFS transporter [Fimbriimonadaceae bacterium]
MSAPSPENHSVFRNTLPWHVGVSSFWFATSFKWFILFFLMSGQVDRLVPGGEKNGWWGLIVAFGALEAMVGPGLYGYLSDRCRSRFGRRRPYIAMGAAFTVLAMLFLGGANQLWMLFVGYIILQVGDDIGTGPYSAIIPDYVPKEERGRSAGIMGLIKLSAQVAAAVTGYVAKGDIVLIYSLMALMHIATAVWTLNTLKEVPFDQTIPKVKFDFSSTFQSILTPFRSADFRWVWLTSFLNAFGFYMILVYVRNYLKDAVLTFPEGMSAQDIDSQCLVKSIMIAVVISLVGACSAMVAGKLSDKIGRKKVVIFSGWIMFLALIPFATIPNFTVIMAMAVPFGIGYGAYLSSDWALVTDVLESENEFGKEMGLWQMSVAAPQVVSGLLGKLVDSLNNRYDGHPGYTVLFLIASFGFLFGSTLVKRIKGSS